MWNAGGVLGIIASGYPASLAVDLERRLDPVLGRLGLRLSVRTGDLIWEYRLLTPPWSGLMATASGLVFGSSNEGNLFALDALTGESLWEMQGGAPARSNPMSFEVDGHQRVVMSAGNAVFALGVE